MKMEFSRLRAKVALILSIEFDVRNCRSDLFNPDLIRNEPKNLRNSTGCGESRIRWSAESRSGEVVRCEEMSLQEFCEQYQRNNCRIIRQPLPARSGKSVWIIRRKFKLLDGGKAKIQR